MSRETLINCDMCESLCVNVVFTISAVDHQAGHSDAGDFCCQRCMHGWIDTLDDHAARQRAKKVLTARHKGQPK